MFKRIIEWFKDEPKYKKPYKLTCQIRYRDKSGWGAPWVQAFTTRKKRNEMIKVIYKNYGRFNVATRKENL